MVTGTGITDAGNLAPCILLQCSIVHPSSARELDKCPSAFVEGDKSGKMHLIIPNGPTNILAYCVTTSLQTYREYQKGGLYVVRSCVLAGSGLAGVAGTHNLEPIFFTLTVDWLQMYYTFINGILMNTIVARIRPDRIG